MKSPSIILASASPRRKQLLREMNLPFIVVKPHGVEETLDGKQPHVLAMRNARTKATAVAVSHQDAFVIGADTIVVVGKRIFGKPSDVESAIEMLRSLAGHQHEVITGVCVVCLATDVDITFYETTRVWMRPLTERQVRDYLLKVDPLDKAGAYAIQEHGEDIVDHIEGSYHNVIGLPTERLRATLEKLGAHR